MKSMVSNSILDAIGNTPMLEVEGIYCKLEFLNPSGSVKARIAKYMIERAEDEGLLKHGESKGARAGTRLLLPGPVRERVERGGEQDLARTRDTGPAARGRHPRRPRHGCRHRRHPHRRRTGFQRSKS